MPDLAFEAEGPLLIAALDRIGVDARPVIWTDTSIRWDDFDATVIRATWDYVFRLEKFLDWVRETDRIFNPPGILEWNTDKHYLNDLQRAGVPVVPTQFISPEDSVELDPEFKDRELVVKPAVSMGARDTEVFDASDSDAALRHVTMLNSSGRAAMVQPYREKIDELAETGLIYLNGQYSHAIRKEQMLRGEANFIADLWRDQLVSARTATKEELQVAEAAVDTVPGGRHQLLYARIDLVPGPDGPELLELEATEPSLYLEFGEGSPDLLAGAILERIT
jgi:glutathione synthase/RimK-type ligase-like ATP-grasp enzyme